MSLVSSSGASVSGTLSAMIVLLIVSLPNDIESESRGQAMQDGQHHPIYAAAAAQVY